MFFIIVIESKRILETWIRRSSNREQILNKLTFWTKKSYFLRKMNCFIVVSIKINLFVEWSFLNINELTFSVTFIFSRFSKLYQFFVFFAFKKWTQFWKFWISFEIDVFLIFNIHVWSHSIDLLISVFMFFIKWISLMTIISKQSLIILFQFSFNSCIDLSIFWFFRNLIKTDESCLMINVYDVMKIIVRTLFSISKLNKTWFLLKKFRIFFSIFAKSIHVSIFVLSWYTRRRQTLVTTRSNILIHWLNK